MYTHRERERESISHASALRKRTTVSRRKKKQTKKRMMRESKLEHVKKTERVTLKHLRSKKEYDLSTRVSAQVVLKEFFSRFFFGSQLVSRWGDKSSYLSRKVSLLSESSRSQIDLNERESVFQSTNHERASSGYSFERIKTGFRDEKSALNSFGIRRRREV